jgi:hypothetical protein
MPDTFAAYSPNGVTADADGMETPAFASQGSTIGKTQSASSQSRDTNTRTVKVGGVDRTVVEGGLHIPIGSPRPAGGLRGVGWEYVCTAVGPESASRVGQRWLVVNSPTKTHMTARRLDVVEVP